MAQKLKVLIIGATGYIGKFLVEASAKAGHPTYAFVRVTTYSDLEKSPIIHDFRSLGVNFVFGDIFDNESLVEAIQQVDVVISAVGREQLGDQDKIISAIKQAGNVKRFFPSEFGSDVDRVHAVEPAKSLFASKVEIRRAVEAEGIPHTFVVSNFFDGYFLHGLSQPGATDPPGNIIKILGDGTTKVIYNKEEDIATYTIRAIDDPRTLNKILYISPPANIYSTNELYSLVEKRDGRIVERIYIPEEEVLKNIQDDPFPANIVSSILYSAFVKGDHTNFDIEPAIGVEASELYPDVQYTTVEEYLYQYV
ncbi:phenylcoumaran benzylic ether reductase POP1-like [Benincasa hispida]|uniref:phenylcoumaran benzylic ether reductase POP1-like n=1 Tax=Benincasa hispida TaxID=102211 RepID=UPI0018FF4A4C|nr:phenylcoumaran benzylic ether reductase POP1-like [Benincasa hispida]